MSVSRYDGHDASYKEMFSYSSFEQSRYLDALLEELGVTKSVTFVAMDWGAALSFYWAYKLKRLCAISSYLMTVSSAISCRSMSLLTLFCEMIYTSINLRVLRLFTVSIGASILSVAGENCVLKRFFMVYIATAYRASSKATIPSTGNV